MLFYQIFYPNFHQILPEELRREFYDTCKNFFFLLSCYFISSFLPAYFIINHPESPARTRAKSARASGPVFGVEVIGTEEKTGNPPFVPVVTATERSFLDAKLCV